MKHLNQTRIKAIIFSLFLFSSSFLSAGISKQSRGSSRGNDYDCTKETKEKEYRIKRAVLMGLFQGANDSGNETLKLELAMMQFKNLQELVRYDPRKYLVAYNIWRNNISPFFNN